MEKTGAERVKYSLACQHEDAIPIKFVSYAQKCPTVLCTFAVALRKESVDRNTNLIDSSRAANWSLSARRAWIEIIDNLTQGVFNLSLSARRAWIEISRAANCQHRSHQVALRKESVDRNIASRQLPTPEPPVALRKESVDRNVDAMQVIVIVMCRSPQGERG